MNDVLPDHGKLRAALIAAQTTENGGLGNQMWAALVDRSGRVTAIAFSGAKLGDQWPASRIIAAQKANAANGLSLDGFALSTANLYSAVQTGGSLYGLVDSNPVDATVAYAGDPAAFGSSNDPLVGKPIGGVNVFAGGLALYAADGTIVGGLGCSGDYSCADHNVAWKVRHALELDYVPAGVDPAHPKGKPADDNVVYDIAEKTGKSASGWGHPICPGTTKEVSLALPRDYPLRSKR